MICPNGHPNPDDHRFCGVCGAPLPGSPSSEDSEGVDTSPRAMAAPPLPPEESPPDAPPETPERNRRRWPLLVGAVVVAAAIAAAGVLLLSRESSEEKYLAALKDAGLDGEYRTDRQAVVAANDACDEFDRTGDPKGSAALEIAVVHYCPEYAEDFEVLDTITVEGTFEIIDYGDYAGRDGSFCEGEGGYGDINSSTAVVVRNLDGDTLARTSLGVGEVDGGSCRFEYSFEVTEGEEQYVLSVGDRGEITYSFEDLRRTGPSLSIG